MKSEQQKTPASESHDVVAVKTTAQTQTPDDVTSGDTWGDRSIETDDAENTSEQTSANHADDERRRLLGKSL